MKPSQSVVLLLGRVTRCAKLGRVKTHPRRHQAGLNTGLNAGLNAGLNTGLNTMAIMDSIIRPEHDADQQAIHRVHVAAFPTPAEAHLVDALRTAGDATVSWVAELDGAVVGHILFSPIVMDSGDGRRRPFGVGLAPMAVMPAHQRTGLGTRLIRAGLDDCRNAGHTRVVVLGHPDYYPRFGFTPASSFEIRSTYDVPDDVFMAQALVPGALDGWSGTVHYAPAFDTL